MNMPRPSMLWIYGLIGAFIIGWYVFGDVNDTPLPSDWTTEIGRASCRERV